MSCQHEWVETTRCSRCGQTVEYRLHVGRLLEAAEAKIRELEAKQASCDALETAGGVSIGLGSLIGLLHVAAFWSLVFVAVARIALG